MNRARVVAAIVLCVVAVIVARAVAVRIARVECTTDAECSAAYGVAYP